MVDSSPKPTVLKRLRCFSILVITTADLSFQKRQLLDNGCTEVLVASIHANILEFMQEGRIF